MELNEKNFAYMKHVEIAIEEFINEFEKSPDLIENSNEKCSYCGDISIYEVK